MARVMASASNLALVQGMADTRETLKRWNAAPWPVLRTWALGALAITVALLLTVLVLGTVMSPGAGKVSFPGLTEPTSLSAVAAVLRRNVLVLALHGFACVAGFIAGSSLPAQAAGYSGLYRRIHEGAGPIAIVFVVAATAFSLASQALSLGQGAATLAAQGGISPALLLLGLLPHAVPELVALFLPLAAWVIASRRGHWHELLAATIATVAIAGPVLLVAAFVEVYVSPQLILALRG